MSGKPTDPSSLKTQFAFTLNRGRKVFVAVMLIATAAIIWPGYALFSSAEPLIFGFPLSFAWIIFWVMISFAAMMGLYLSDSKHENRD